MSKTAADILIETLVDWGVEVIFGLPGDGINGIMESLRKQKDHIRFIQVRHEESAAFMACGYAKVTGRLGVCLSTSGPGGLHLLNGLYDAKLDGQAVLAITGMHHHDLLDTFSQQDVSLDKVFQDVADYNARVMGPNHVRAVANLACQTSLSNRAVSHICFPVDFQSQLIKEERASSRNTPQHSTPTPLVNKNIAEEEPLIETAKFLNRGEKIAILAGRGALNAGNELEKIAEKLGAPIIKALLGKAVVPDDSPYTTGGIGLLGTKPSQTAMEECDTLLMVGTSFPYLEFYPEPGSIKCIQIDNEATRIGLRHPVNVGIVGDSKITLAALLPLLKEKKDKDFLKKAQDGMKDWWEKMETQASSDHVPMKPQVAAWELNPFLENDAIVVCDSGTVSTWWARHIKVKKGQMHTVSGNLASMACALPYAIAAQIAFPKRQVVAIVGDGGLSMGLAELATCVKYNLAIKIMIIKNNSLSQIKWEQMVFLGNPEYGCELEPIDFVKIAEGFGLVASSAEKPEDCFKVFSSMMSHPGPALIEAVVDPLEPPMPPKTTLKQATQFLKSLAKGEPDATQILRTVTKNKVREMV